jgi:hypothetical protein
VGVGAAAASRGISVGACAVLPDASFTFTAGVERMYVEIYPPIYTLYKYFSGFTKSTENIYVII